MGVVGECTSCLVDTTCAVHTDGWGVLVDPERDADRFLATAGVSDVPGREAA